MIIFFQILIGLFNNHKWYYLLIYNQLGVFDQALNTDNKFYILYELL